MLKEELDERATFVEVIKNPYFSDFIKSNPGLLTRVYPEFEGALKKAVKKFPSYVSVQPRELMVDSSTSLSPSQKPQQ